MDCWSVRRSPQSVKEIRLRAAIIRSKPEFQSQGRDVIVVSTVHSNKSYVDDDVTNHLGFPNPFENSLVVYNGS